jgi:hypothetical protein
MTPPTKQTLTVQLSAEDSALIITALLVASAFYLEHPAKSLTTNELRDCANYVLASNEMNTLAERFQALRQ